MLSCEIVSVGTELLLGDIVDTNAQYLSRELAAMGIAVLHRGTVGDNAERLRGAVELALSRSDVVLLTGGLGPTADDITKEVCAQVMGYALVRDGEAEDAMRAFFKTRGRPMPESNLKQADVPQGGIVFHNDHGTAPGMAMERDGKSVILLPGPPNEMRAMFTDKVKPYLAAKTTGVIVSHTVRTMGVGESDMAERVAPLLEGSNPTVAPYAKQGEALLRVTAHADTKEQAEKLIEPVLSQIRSILGDYIYGIDVEDIQHAVVQALLRKKLHVATAESCTAGYISKRITEVAGASDVFACGLVTYSNDMKEKLLGVRHETLQRYGAVSAETAAEMAAGARRVSGADIAVAVTGVAGPGCSENKPVGLVWFGIADRSGVRTVRFETGRKDREFNRYVTASRALHLVWQSIQNY
jgi:nicotinamide-nucleotide amidase